MNTTTNFKINFFILKLKLGKSSEKPNSCGHVRGGGGQNCMFEIILDLLICISKNDKKHILFSRCPQKPGFALRRIEDMSATMFFLRLPLYLAA